MLQAYEPSNGTVSVTQIVYALHTVSILVGLTTGASIAGAFIFSWPSILAVILNYVFRGDAESTYVESHFAWQIRTFWMAALWRECQDFCVWGGYSRGSPTRLPFVFEMQYARPGALAREV